MCIITLQLFAVMLLVGTVVIGRMLSTSAACLPVTDDAAMDTDDIDYSSVVSVDTDEETTLNSLLNNFAKYLAFLKLKIPEENMLNTLPAAAASSVLIIL